MLREPLFIGIESSRADRFPQILCLTDKGGTILSMNRRGQDVFCCPDESVTGWHISDLFAPSERERFVAECARTVDGAGSPPSPYTVLDRNRRPARVLPVFTPAGEGFWVNLVEIDADAGRHTPDMRQTLLTFMDTFPQTFFEFDEHGTITYVNHHGLLEFGFTAEDLEGGLNAYDLIALPDRTRAYQNVAYRMDGRIPACHEYTFLRKDGSTVPVIVHSVAVTKNGEATGTWGLVIDISEIRAAQEELEQMNQTLKLVSTLTRHELMNILTALAGWVDLAAGVTTEPDVDRYLKKATEAAGMLRKHLDFSREIQQVGTAAPTWQDLDAAVGSARSYLENGVQNLTIRTETAGVRVLADTLFDRVFYILLENSLRHGKGVTEVRVRVEGSLIVYEDNGCGVPVREKKRIFELGYGKNTGFGLYLARRILAVTGIKIKEEGEPGTGARFVLSIPQDQIRFF
ncbi:PAS domain-containing sensor histidine kinase [Methanofollis formosanus]|uniref:histidine kinase n=1 Tax=Methanofollis formosanus TaxID=299308 RepID=A0A8G1EE68_9EURY|nr:PAS domain S-box protein [Methanofollis formosanus]QYZ77968.1 PAS domain-containing sensor histidine kinase [Methanofollis formosanus]